MDLDRRKTTWLAGMVIAAAASGALPRIAMAGSHKRKISAPEAYEAAQSGKIMLIDIRRPSEWENTGVPEGALTVTMHADGGPAEFLENIRKAVSNDPSAPIALICARGVRTRWAQRFLIANGFTNVLDVSEGMFGRGSGPGWLKRGLPVTPFDASGQ